MPKTILIIKATIIIAAKALLLPNPRQVRIHKKMLIQRSKLVASHALTQGFGWYIAVIEPNITEQISDKMKSLVISFILFMVEKNAPLNF